MKIRASTNRCIRASKTTSLRTYARCQSQRKNLELAKWSRHWLDKGSGGTAELRPYKPVPAVHLNPVKIAAAVHNDVAIATKILIRMRK